MTRTARRSTVGAHRALIEGRRPPRRGRALRATMAGTLVALVLIGAGVIAFELGLESGTSPTLTVRPAVSIQQGSSDIGSAAYPVPEGALVVAPDGDDAAEGTLDAPLATVQEAVNRAEPGATIVLRGGSYRQRVTITDDHPVTIQPYPGEAVWFEGSRVVDNWSPDGTVWTASSWTTVFDTSPTFTKGAPDNTEPGFSFLDPQHPLAAHPDQLWIDGVAQVQVSTPADVTAGTFAVDTAASTLTIGTDPSGREVRASDRIKAMEIMGAGSTVRGIGFRRYAPSVPNFGTVSIERDDVTLEDVVIEDSATLGLFVTGRNAVVRNVTVTRSGMLGVSANAADALTLAGIVSTGNNTEHFQTAPVSGGIKVTKSRDVTVSNSLVADNLGPGLWFDQSVRDMEVTGSVLSGNAGHGLILEISSTALVANVRATGNADNGIKVNDTDSVTLWQTTVEGNGRGIVVVQDERRATDPTVPGHDSREGDQDPAMTWITADVVIGNSIISSGEAECALCVEDRSGEFTGEQMVSASDGNLYPTIEDRTGALVVWSAGPGDPLSFPTLAGFRDATGQELHSLEVPEELPPLIAGPIGADARLHRLLAVPTPFVIAGRMGVNPLVATIGATVSGDDGS